MLTELCVHACVAYMRAFVHVYQQVLTDLPGADVLRLMRCFRVFRLFKRIASLRKIMGALTKSRKSFPTETRSNLFACCW